MPRKKGWSQTGGAKPWRGKGSVGKIVLSVLG